MPTVKGREIGFIRLLHDFAISASSPLPGALSPNSIFDVALDLLKRHSGIVWDPGRFAGLLRCWDVRRWGTLPAHPLSASRICFYTFWGGKYKAERELVIRGGAGCR